MTRERADLRGDQITMIFQEPMTSLNPVFTIGDQIAEVVERHRKVSKAEARKVALDMLTRVAHPVAGKAARRISAPDVRRHAPARHDRDGAGQTARSC